MESTNLTELLTLRPASEYHEDMGPVLWWVLPITEPPYVGGPNDCGQTVEIRTAVPHVQHNLMDKMRDTTRIFVGGWPGYHTHWSPIPSVATPKQ